MKFCFQDSCLHEIMPIFTFVGSSVLRMDDAYSFQIILKIIESVVPILIQVSIYLLFICVFKLCFNLFQQLYNYLVVPI